VKVKIPEMSNEFWAVYCAVFFAFNCWEFALGVNRITDLVCMIVMAAFGYWHAGGCMSSGQANAIRALEVAAAAAGSADEGWPERFCLAFAAEGYELAGRDSGGIFVRKIKRGK
jgi:hypothetical protein